MGRLAAKQEYKVTHGCGAVPGATFRQAVGCSPMVTVCGIMVEGSLLCEFEHAHKVRYDGGRLKTKSMQVFSVCHST